MKSDNVCNSEHICAHIHVCGNASKSFLASLSFIEGFSTSMAYLVLPGNNAALLNAYRILSENSGFKQPPLSHL